MQSSQLHPIHARNNLHAAAIRAPHGPHSCTSRAAVPARATNNTTATLSSTASSLLRVAEACCIVGCTYTCVQLIITARDGRKAQAALQCGPAKGAKLKEERTYVSQAELPLASLSWSETVSLQGALMLGVLVCGKLASILSPRWVL